MAQARSSGLRDGTDAQLGGATAARGGLRERGSGLGGALAVAVWELRVATAGVPPRRWQVGGRAGGGLREGNLVLGG
jgi:hypothetical protein